MEQERALHGVKERENSLQNLPTQEGATMRRGFDGVALREEKRRIHLVARHSKRSKSAQNEGISVTRESLARHSKRSKRSKSVQNEGIAATREK
jgi:hypothetical protein